ncbi:MAG: ATP-binding protein [bacterium]
MKKLILIVNILSVFMHINVVCVNAGRYLAPPGVITGREVSGALGKAALSKEVREKLERLIIAVRSLSHNEGLLDINKEMNQINCLIGELYLKDVFADKRDDFELIQEIIVDKIAPPLHEDQRRFTNASPDQFNEDDFDLYVGRFKAILQKIVSLQEVFERLNTAIGADFARMTDRNERKNYENIWKKAQGALFITIKKMQSRIEFAEGIVSQAEASLVSIVESACADNPTVLLTADIDPGIYVKGNEISLISAVQNLINNAVALEISRHGEDAKVHVLASVKDNAIQIKIIDHAQGIPPELLKVDPETGRLVIFNLNVTTREGGTGLGTTEAWYVIRDCGGNIDIASLTDEKYEEINLPASIAKPVSPDMETVVHLCYEKIDEYLREFIDLAERIEQGGSDTLLDDVKRLKEKFERFRLRGIMREILIRQGLSDRDNMLQSYEIVFWELKDMIEADTISAEKRQVLINYKNEIIKIHNLFKRINNGQRVETGTTITLTIPIASILASAVMPADGIALPAAEPALLTLNTFSQLAECSL